MSPYSAGVMVWIEDRFLLLRRSFPPHAGSWALPGGRLESGEHPRAAAVRELYEETGIRLPTSALRPYRDVDGPRGRYRVYRASLSVETPSAVSVKVNSESDASSWPTHEEAWAYRLHPGMEALLADMPDENPY